MQRWIRALTALCRVGTLISLVGCGSNGASKGPPRAAATVTAPEQGGADSSRPEPSRSEAKEQYAFLTLINGFVGDCATDGDSNERLDLSADLLIDGDEQGLALSGSNTTVRLEPGEHEVVVIYERPQCESGLGRAGYTGRPTFAAGRNYALLVDRHGTGTDQVTDVTTLVSGLPGDQLLINATNGAATFELTSIDGSEPHRLEISALAMAGVHLQPGQAYTATARSSAIGETPLSRAFEASIERGPAFPGGYDHVYQVSVLVLIERGNSTPTFELAANHSRIDF